MLIEHACLEIVCISGGNCVSFCYSCRSVDSFVCDISFGNQKFNWKVERFDVKVVRSLLNCHCTFKGSKTTVWMQKLLRISYCDGCMREKD